MYLSDITDIINEMFNQILYLAIFIIISAITIVWLLSKTITEPIKKIDDAARKIASGDFNVYIDIKNQDEIGNLSNSINYMSKQLRMLFSEVNRQKEQLTGILGSIQEGVAVTDINGRILLCNAGFNKIATINQCEGIYIYDIFHNYDIQKHINKLIKRKSNIIKEIDFNNKTIILSSVYLELKSEIIIVIHDISEIKKLERIKRDIVANVSHELRTPMTAIKGFLETLIAETNIESHSRYLNIIKRHTDRLISIIQDLLILSELDERNTKLELSDVNVYSLVENTSKIYEQKLKEKNIEFSIITNDKTIEVSADSFRIEQVIINLIDNAIKYTEFGRIDVMIDQKEDNIIITVKDTGVGIPKADKERIFERFYTADKSRSRKVGGSGLGLAIVKHIVLQHGGTIDVESTINAGSSIIVMLPKNSI